MKTMTLSLSSLAFAGALLCSTTPGFAQMLTETITTTTTTTNATGTVSQFGPDSIVVKTTTSTDPLSYSSTKTTTYVDENGNPVSMSTVKSGLPVTVYYDMDGNKMVATKVVVRKSTTVDPVTAQETTTTTTSSGTISQFNPSGFGVRTTTSSDPLNYTYTKTTTYVDENGAPVEITTVKSGVPVTVYYNTDGTKMVATKVIVRKSSAGPTSSIAP